MPRVICFDFDDVLTEKSAIPRFLNIFGHKFREIQYGVELLEDNKDPKKFFKTIKKAVMLGKGIKYERLEKISLLLKPSRNAALTMKKLKKSKYRIVVVSINDEIIIKKFLRQNKLDKYVSHVYASKLGRKGKLLDGTISGDVVKTAKCGVIPRIEKTFRAKKSDIFYVGDGMTDLPIIKKLGRGILFCPNETTQLEVFADRQLYSLQRAGKIAIIKDRNLARILPLIGERS